MIGNISNTPDYENLSVLERNRLPQRAYFIPAASLDECKKTGSSKNRADSSRMTLLSGSWDFKYYSSIFEVPDDIVTNSSTVMDKIPVPSCWQCLGYGITTYLNIRYQIPGCPPKVPNDNPTGVYKKRFLIAGERAEQKKILSFSGVSSAFHVYVNGQMAGYSQGSHNMSEFDVTGLCRDGENEVCVIVYHYSDGSYLETQDYFRNSGIFRDVYVTFSPKTHIYDFFFDPKPDDSSLESFTAKLDVTVSGKDYDRIQMLLCHGGREIINQDVSAGANTVSVKKPMLWTAETPEVYDLYLVLWKDGKVLECVSMAVGFKHIEIKDGVFYLNNQNIKLRGCNRHDYNYKDGYVVSMKQMEDEIAMLKRFNVNCIRTSHYPNDPRFLELCDRMGMYLVDEMDLETHGATWMEHDTTDYKVNWSYFSRNPDWEKAFVDRASRMVLRDRNHPSVTMWSLGNESGFIRNHKVCYDYIKTVDPKIPVHYEGAIYDECAGFDVVSMMYPDFNEIKSRVTGEDMRPFFLCEYTHGTGPAPAGLEPHWELIYEHDRAMGGCVWELHSHSAIRYNQDGTVRYKYGYGGDFDEGINDSSTGCNGFFTADDIPKKGAYRMKHAYRPVHARLLDKKPLAIELINRYDFTDTNGVRFTYEITENGQVTGSGRLDVKPIPPHGKAEISIPGTVSADRETFVTVYCHDSDGNELCFEQLLVSAGKSFAPERGQKTTFTITENYLEAVVSADNFELIFDKRYGTVKSINVDSHELLCLDSKNKGVVSEFSRAVPGPRLNFWRSPVSFCDDHVMGTWYKYGFDCIETHINRADLNKSADSVEFSVNAFYGPKAKLPLFEADITYRLGGDKLLDISAKVRPLIENLPHFPRLGFVMDLDCSFDRVEYYGRGDIENYIDAKEGTKIGIFNQSVDELGEIAPVPQEMGNRTDVRYTKFIAPESTLTVYSDDLFNMNAHHYTQENLTRARHPEDFGQEMLTEINLDCVMSPVGSFFCGYPDDTKENKVYPEGEIEFGFTLKFN